jgi:hypothetical protein
MNNPCNIDRPETIVHTVIGREKRVEQIHKYKMAGMTK